MKKIVLLSLFALCLPLLVMAQSNNDDLYFVPSKEKAGSQKDSCEEGTGKKLSPRTFIRLRVLR